MKSVHILSFCGPNVEKYGLGKLQIQAFFTQRVIIFLKIFNVEYLAKCFHTTQYKENICVRREKAHKGRIEIKQQQ